MTDSTRTALPTDREHDATLAAKMSDADVFTEAERDDIARIAVALNMSPARWPGIATTELHHGFIALLMKTKALRAHVEHGHAEARAEGKAEGFAEGLDTAVKHLDEHANGHEMAGLHAFQQGHEISARERALTAHELREKAHQIRALAPRPAEATASEPVGIGSGNAKCGNSGCFHCYPFDEHKDGRCIYAINESDNSRGTAEELRKVLGVDAMDVSVGDLLRRATELRERAEKAERERDEANARADAWQTDKEKLWGIQAGDYERVRAERDELRIAVTRAMGAFVDVSTGVIPDEPKQLEDAIKALAAERDDLQNQLEIARSERGDGGYHLDMAHRKLADVEAERDMLRTRLIQAAGFVDEVAPSSAMAKTLRSMFPEVFR